MKIKKIVIIIILIFSIIPVTLITGISIITISSDLKAIVKQNAEATVQIQSKTIEKFFEQRRINFNVISKLSICREFLVESNTNNHSTNFENYYLITNQILETRVKEEPFLQRISIINKTKRVVASSDKEAIGTPTLMTDEYFNLVRNSEEIITKILSNSNFYNNNKHFIISYPIMNNNKFEGCMLFVMDIKYFEDMVNSMEPSKTNNLTIIDVDGDIIATNNDYNEKEIYLELKQKIINNETSGFIEYKDSDSNKIIYYSQLPNTEWIVFDDIEMSDLNMPINQIIKMVLLFLVIIILLVAAIYFFISRCFSKPLNSLLYCIGKMKKGDYDIRCCYTSNNEFGEISKAFNSLMDIIVSDNKELMIKEERYRIVNEQSNDIIFEFNLNDKYIYYSSDYKKVLNYSLLSKNFPDTLIQDGIVYNDDIHDINELWENTLKNIENNKKEVRLKKEDNNFIWCLIQITTLCDESKRPIKGIGKIIDINEQKCQTERLIYEAKRDLLTKLYNKTTTERMITECIKLSDISQRHALFTIDIDNFKSINDNLGHMYGDKVLVEIAKKISSIFRSSDIIGRIGGDEFVVLLKNFHSDDIVIKKAEHLVEVLENSYTQGDRVIKVSGSIGISLYPEHGTNFKDLFEKSDKALYYAKSESKDCYQIFDKSLEESCFIIQMENTRNHKNIGLNQKSIAEYVFNVLYGDSNISQAINKCLEMIGKYYNVSRVYIYDYYNGTKNIFEWCNKGIGSQIDTLKDLTYNEYKAYKKEFDDNGLFYCNNILELEKSLYEVLNLHKVTSLLQCLIIYNEIDRGFIGFDECNTQRLWTKDEVDTLLFITKIIGIFLAK